MWFDPYCMVTLFPFNSFSALFLFLFTVTSNLSPHLDQIDYTPHPFALLVSHHLGFEAFCFSSADSPIVL